MKDFGSKTKYGFWTIFPVTVGIVFASLIFPGKQLAELSPAQPAAVIESTTQKEETPRYYFVKEENKDPKVSAGAYLVGDLDTGEIILSKYETEKYPIASVSKLMTAYLSNELSENETESIAVVSKKALSTYGQNGNFRTGEKIKVSELLYPLLLESSNDAAEVLAEHFDRDVFIRKMNKVAEILELPSTSFEDPSGLSENNQSTVSDLFRLVGYIKQKANELFDITLKRSYSTKTHNWSSNNQFLKQDGYTGGKSGYTDPAKQTVVSTFSLPLSETGTRNIGIILLQSNDRYKDVLNILSYLKKNVYYGGKSDATLAWVKEKAGSPDIKDPDFVTLLFGGDIMFDRGVESSVIKNFDGDFSALFENMEILKRADITFANLEGPVSDEGEDRKNLYSFRMDPAVVPALKGAGLDIVSVANNHVGDWGREAYEDTLRHLEENEIFYTGGGITRIQAEEPIIIEKYDIKVGYLGFSDVGPDWMRARDNESGLLLASDPRLEEIIQKASKKVDYLVVSFHFGEEYKTVHNDRQEYLSHKAIDAGAKVVVGHHPHVTEDTEVYKDGFIAYSLGNLIFDQAFSENTMKGMLLEVKIDREGGMSVRKNTIKLNKFFQPDRVILGKEEKLKIPTSQ